MAQDGPQGNHGGDMASNNHGFAPPPPPTAVTYPLMSPRPYDNGGNSTGDLEKRKNILPDLNKEQCDSADGSHAIAQGSKPKFSSALEVATAAAAAAAASNVVDQSKGKSAMPAYADGELKIGIIVERERRRRMNEFFKELQGLMPHVPEKMDKAALVGEAVKFVKTLEAKKAALEKWKREQALARQARAASSSSTAAPQAQTAHGLAAMSSSGVHAWPGVPPPPPTAAVPAPPAQFRSWSTPNVVLTVLNNSAYINVCAPRRRGIVTMAASVLNSYGIDVVTVQIASDSVRSMFTILANVTGRDGQNRPAEEVYQLAVSEIVRRLNLPM